MKTEYITFYILFHNSKKVQNTRKRSEVKVLSYGGCRLHFRSIFLFLGTFLQFFFCCPYFQYSLSKYIKQNIWHYQFLHIAIVAKCVIYQVFQHTLTWNTFSMNCGTLNLILDENRFIKSYFTSINFEMKALTKSQLK